MTDEDLRDQLAEADPCPPTRPVDGVGSPRAQNLLEDIMTTPIDHPEADNATEELTTNGRHTRRWAAVLAGAAGVAVVAAVALNGPLGSSPELPQLALAMPVSDATGSCPIFDPAQLAAAPVAFSGTVASVSSTTVVLDVDRWYASDTAQPAQVELGVDEGQGSAALDGVDFAAGERYLVTASGGVVNGCGLSGEASPELEALFSTAFPG